MDLCLRGGCGGARAANRHGAEWAVVRKEGPWQNCREEGHKKGVGNCNFHYSEFWVGRFHYVSVSACPGKQLDFRE